MICSHCNAENNSDAKFCDQCGNRFTPQYGDNDVVWNYYRYRELGEGFAYKGYYYTSNPFPAKNLDELSKLGYIFERGRIDEPLYLVSYIYGTRRYNPEDHTFTIPVRSIQVFTTNPNTKEVEAGRQLGIKEIIVSTDE